MPLPTYTLVEAGPDFPINKDEAKQWLRIEDPEDDALLLRMIEGVTISAELETGRDLRAKDWTATFDGFPDSTIFEIKKNPVTVITSISYLRYDDAGGDDTVVVPAADYFLVLGRQWASVFLRPELAGDPAAGTWPTDVSERTPVQNVTIAFSTTAFEESAALNIGLQLHLAALWQNRGDCPPGMTVAGMVILANDMAARSGAMKYYEQVRITR